MMVKQKRCSSKLLVFIKGMKFVLLFSVYVLSQLGKNPQHGFNEVPRVSQFPQFGETRQSSWRSLSQYQEAS